MITYENNDNSVQYFEAFAHEIITNFESDYETIVAMILYRKGQNQVYLYTPLSQDDFMKKINEALCYLPQLPISFSGDYQPNWDNYMACRSDYLNALLSGKPKK